MKILKKRELNKFEHNTQCTLCRSDLMVEESDVILVRGYVDPRPGESQPDSYKFVCPVCRENNYIENRLIPEHVKRKIRSGAMSGVMGY